MTKTKLAASVSKSAYKPGSISYPESSGFLVSGATLLMTKKPEDSGYKIESNQENRQHLKCFRSVLATSHKTN